jgi:manganese/zinc/iron transport system permease protein
MPDYTLRMVLLGSTLSGLSGGVLGCYALLRRQSLIGDALAHAALPGVCLAFWLTRDKAPLPLLTGALVAGVLGALSILGIVRWSRVKEDSAIGIILSVFFGTGMVLLTFLQRQPFGNQSGLDRYLFGQAATLMMEDVLFIAGLGGIALLAVAVLFKEFKLLAFDRAFGASLGFPMRGLEIGLTGLLVLVVVLGLQAVGAILIIASLITPAAAARQWTDRMGTMIFLSAAVGAVASLLGALASASMRNLPTGPAIVLVSSGFLAFSLLLAPRRGILWGWLRGRKVQRSVRWENLLKDLHHAAEEDAAPDRFVLLPQLMGFRGQRAGIVRGQVRGLEEEGWVERQGAEGVRLTDAGRREARRVVRKHRLWELYLARRLELPPDHVHRDAEAMEHILSDESVDQIDRLLGHPVVDPHGRPIPPREET